MDLHRTAESSARCPNTAHSFLLWWTSVPKVLLDKVVKKAFRRKAFRECNNTIHTSKYTVASFVPKSLYCQFSRFSNVYFLTIGVMQLFPAISDSGGMPMILFPLSLVVMVSSIKDLIEDLRRHRADAEENSRRVKVCVDGRVEERRWGDLYVGNIVKLERGERFPADLIVLGCSGECGVCYVETKNLDGETNLKHKVGIPSLVELFTSDSVASSVQVHFTCDPPKSELHTFSGSIQRITTQPGKGVQNSHVTCGSGKCSHGLSKACQAFKLSRGEWGCRPVERNVTQLDVETILEGPIPVGIGQFLLRGSSLVNTAWLYGLVVYVSKDTRIFQNVATKTTFKWSHLERTYNRHVLLLVTFELLFCLLICIGAVSFSRVQWYLCWDVHERSSGLLENLAPGDSVNELTGLSIGEAARVVLTVFGSMIILFAYFVPIDLFLTLEIVRFLQGAFVAWDKDMLSPGDNVWSSQSAHLLEELGNTTHIFTDKTGTLTQNVMLFRCLSVGNFTVVSESFASLFENLESGVKTKTQSMLNVARSIFVKNPTNIADVYFNEYPIRIQNRFSQLCLNDVERVLSFSETIEMADCEQIRYFLLSLSTCHTVLVRDSATVMTACPHGAGVHDLIPWRERRAPPERQAVFLPEWLVPEALTFRLKSAESEEMNEDEALNCHYWVVENPRLAEYDASSPDELALVSAAQSMGIELYRRLQVHSVQLRLITTFAQEWVLGPLYCARWETWVKNHALQFPTKAEKVEGKVTTTRWVPVITLEVLDILEFDNMRKRMSVIIRDRVPCNHWTLKKATLRGRISYAMHDEEYKRNSQEMQQEKHHQQQKEQISNLDGRTSPPTVVQESDPASLPIVLLSKGADCQMMAAASPCQAEYTKRLMERVNAFARSGLRNLVFGWRVIPSEEYEVFHRSLVLARRCSITEDMYTGKTKFNKLTDVTNSISRLDTLIGHVENSLLLSGCSGVEDKLQRDVPNVIRDLQACGIRFWVLTGDKPETAVNVGYSAQLLKSNSYNFILDGTSAVLLERQLDNLIERCRSLNLLLTDSSSTFDKDETSVSSVNNRKARNSGVSMYAWGVFTWFPPFFGRGHGPISQKTVFGQRGSGESLQSSFSCTVPNIIVSKEENSGEPTVKFIEEGDDDLHTEIDMQTKTNQSLYPCCYQDDTSPQGSQDFSVTITGAAFRVLQDYPRLLKQFYAITRVASVVIACRVTPRQKALIVTQSSELNPECTSSLAIGDGANDVAMILSADTGVGIAGREGTQATRAADFAVAEFRSLRKLLLVHGREALRRNSFLMYYAIFKNIAFCVASFCYQFFCGFSGQDIYNFWIKSLYGTVFVAPTAILYGIIDRELPHYILERAPVAYCCMAPVQWPFKECLAPAFQWWQVNVTAQWERCTYWIFPYCWQWIRNNRACAQTPKNRLCSITTKGVTCSSGLWFGRHAAFHKRHKTVPVGARSYGTSLLLIWLVYAFYVGVTITVLPLYVLNDAVSVDRRTFVRQMEAVRSDWKGLFDKKDVLVSGIKHLKGPTAISTHKTEVSVLQRSFVEENNVALPSEGKAGFDLAAVGMVTLFECILICNLIVGLAINTLFWFQALLTLGILTLFICLWAMTSWPALVHGVAPGLQAVSGTFRMVFTCTAYYFCVFLSVFICLLPIWTARVVKVFFKPNIVVIIKERMLQGVFDIVIGRQSFGSAPMTVLVPKRQRVLLSTELANQNGGSLGKHVDIGNTVKLSSFGDNDDRQPNDAVIFNRSQSKCLIGESLTASRSSFGSSSSAALIVKAAEFQRASSALSGRVISQPQEYTGFAFAYEETLVSSPPSVWVLASVAFRAGKNVGYPLLSLGKDVSLRFFGGLRGSSIKFIRSSEVSLDTSEEKKYNQIVDRLLAKVDCVAYATEDRGSLRG